MAPLPSDAPRLKDLHADLERALISEYLQSRGYDPQAIFLRDDPEARALRKEASVYAAAKLTEVEARAHYVHEVHHVGEDRG